MPARSAISCSSAAAPQELISVSIFSDAISPGDRVLMVDDLLATGGTMEAGLKLVRRIGGDPVACVFAIELSFLNGRDRLGDVPVHSLMRV
mgnify:CR=1 FL=1